MLILMSMVIGVTLYPTYLISESVNTSQRVLFGISMGFAGLVVLVRSALRRNSTFLDFDAIPFLILFVAAFFHFLLIENTDPLESLNALRYVFYFLLLSIGKGTRFNALGQHRLYAFVVLVEGVFVMMQYVIPNEAIVTAFSRHHLITYAGRRVGGTFNWTYTLGAVLVMLAANFQAKVTLVRGVRRKIAPMSLFLACVVLVFATQSRTAIATMAVVSVYVGYLLSKNPVRFARYGFVGGFLFGLVFLISTQFIDFTYVLSTTGSSALSEGVAGLKLTQRVFALSAVLEMSGIEWLLGADGAMRFTIENAYGDYLYKYGLIGLAGYLSLLAMLTHRTWLLTKLLQSAPVPVRSFVVGMHGFSVGLFFFSLSSSPLDAHKLGTVIFLLFGLAFGLSSMVSGEQARLNR